MPTSGELTDGPSCPQNSFSNSDASLSLGILAFFCMVAPFAFGTTQRIFGDGDVSWHLAAGRWIIEHRQIPMVDPFSYTAFGKPWIAHEWLAELFMAVAFGGLGYAGVAFLVATAFGLTILIIGLWLRRWATPVELCLALMIISLALAPLTVARPMVLVWPILALWTSELLRARVEDRVPSWWLVPTMTLWINMHASFVFGLFLAGAFALEALLQASDRRRSLFGWSAFGLASLVAALINPHGFGGVMFPFYILNSSVVTVIDEFRPTTFTDWPTFEAALLLIIGVSWWRGARLSVIRILLMTVVLHLAMVHARHQTVFVIIAALVAVPALTIGRANDQPPNSQIFAGVSRRRQLAAIAAAVGIFCAIGAARSWWRITPRESVINPVKAFANIPADLRHKAVLNEYSLGGPLILRGIPVFIDGRSDLYGDKYVLDYVDVSEGHPQKFARAQRKWNFCWAIFPPDNKAIVQLLDQTADWRRIYADKFAIIHVRRSCASER